MNDETSTPPPSPGPLPVDSPGDAPVEEEGPKYDGGEIPAVEPEPENEDEVG